MLKILKRHNWSKGQNITRFPAYVDMEASMLKRKFRQLYKERSEIDFDSIPELLATSRSEKDTIKSLWLNKRVAGCVRARDGYPEHNISHPMRDIYTINRDIVSINSSTQPFMLSIDDDSEYFKVTIEDVHFNIFHQNWPMLIMWNRFTPGKPNRMKMKVMVDEWEKSEPNLRGGRLVLVDNYVNVDVYTETWPKVLKANMNEIVPGKSYTISDLEKDLPDGIELAPEYKNKRNEALFTVQKTIKSYIYWQYLKHQYDTASIADVDFAQMNIELIGKAKEEIKIKESSLITKEEEDKLKKLAVMLNKDFESMKNEIIQSRLKKKLEEQKKEEKKEKTVTKK